MVNFSILLRCSRHHRLPMMVQMMKAQACSPEDMVIGIDLNEEDEMSQGDFYSLYPEVFDTRIKVMFFNDDPSGYMLNRMYEVSTGDYICVWDDDDFYGRCYLSLLKELIRERNLKLLGHAPKYRWFPDNGELVFKPDDDLPGYKSSIPQSCLCFYRFIHPNPPWDDEDVRGIESYMLKQCKEMGLRPYVVGSPSYVKGFYGNHLSNLDVETWYSTTEQVNGITSEREVLDFLALEEVRCANS